jgi:hypothetical protein
MRIVRLPLQNVNSVVFWTFCNGKRADAFGIRPFSLLFYLFTLRLRRLLGSSC